MQNDNGQSILADISIGLLLTGIIMIVAITIIKSATDSGTDLMQDDSPEKSEVEYQSISAKFYYFDFRRR